uniref:Uncharacterized protein n=3 Tax=unclassified bacterial viruses TaxID=12333 RepID=A0AAU6VZI0_9VIRU
MKEKMEAIKQLYSQCSRTMCPKLLQELLSKAA